MFLLNVTFFFFFLDEEEDEHGDDGGVRMPFRGVSSFVFSCEMRFLLP